MADDRQLADIWRHQYTGPLFRKYAGLEQIPEASIGYLARQSRLAVDFCQTMMKPLGLKQYAVNTPISLPSGETGIMRTHVIAGFGGMPIVTTRVELERKIGKEEKEEQIPLFYYYDPVNDTGKIIGLTGQKFSAFDQKLDIVYTDDMDYCFWTGTAEDEVSIIIGNKLYGVGGEFIQDLPEEHEYSGTFQKNGIHYAVTATHVYKVTSEGLTVAGTIEDSTFFEVNQSATKMLVRTDTQYLEYLIGDDDSFSILNRTDLVIQEDNLINRDEESNINGTFDEVSEEQPGCYGFVRTPTGPLGIYDYRESKWEYKYTLGAWFDEDDAVFSYFEEQSHYLRDEKEEHWASIWTRKTCLMGCQDIPQCFFVSNAEVYDLTSFEKVKDDTYTLFSKITNSSEIIFPETTFESTIDRESTRTQIFAQSGYTELTTRDAENAWCVYGLMGCYVVGLGEPVTTFESWSTPASDTRVGYQNDVSYEILPYAKFGVFCVKKTTQIGTEGGAYAETAYPWEIKNNDQILQTLDTNGWLIQAEHAFNNDGALVFHLVLVDENDTALAFGFYNGELTDLTEVVQPNAEVTGLLIPLRATV